MNKNSNKYIIIYASIMVIVVATVLTFVATSLGGIQAENVRIEKMGDILRAIGEGQDADKASNKATYITEQYEQYVVESYAVKADGEKIEDVDAFNLLLNLKAEYDKPREERKLPVFVSKNASGQIDYVVPLWGKGLWGPVWGYVALGEDWSTVTGVVFDHQGETPGLGAEIATSGFQAQFKGKHILNDQGEVVGITLKKGGGTANDSYAVDGLTGGTLTSKGVQDMILNNLGDYAAYIAKERAMKNATSVTDGEGTNNLLTENNQQDNE